MRRLSALLALTAFPALVACESVLEPGPRAPEPLTTLPRALSVSEAALVGASNRFAFDLLREASARAEGPNVFLSPLSASMALGMAAGGAGGETYTEMRSMLGFGEMGPAEVGASYRGLTDLLLGLDPAVDLRVANSIWVREGFPLHDAFVESSRHFFGAETTALDFLDPGAPAVVNRWVSESTGGRIPGIVERIPPEMVAYLINAVYFKGSWTRRFDPARTHDAPFRLADGSTRTTKMMYLSGGEVRHAQVGGVEIVDLPYGRAAFSMTVVVPPAGGTLQETVASLDAARWDAWMEALRDSGTDVYLPRFRLEYEQTLNETLKALGMRRAFAPGADFSGMSPTGGLIVDAVKQKTFVEVNEEGTEAAAATSVEIGVTSLPAAFRADRPFLVAIRERLTGTILFLGTIGEPQAG